MLLFQAISSLLPTLFTDIEYSLNSRSFRGNGDILFSSTKNFDLNDENKENNARASLTSQKLHSPSSPFKKPVPLDLGRSLSPLKESSLTAPNTSTPLKSNKPSTSASSNRFPKVIPEDRLFGQAKHSSGKSLCKKYRT